MKTSYFPNTRVGKIPREVAIKPSRFYLRHLAYFPVCEIGSRHQFFGLIEYAHG